MQKFTATTSRGELEKGWSIGRSRRRTAEKCTVCVSCYRGSDLVASQRFDYGEDAILNGDLDAFIGLAVLISDFTSLTEVTIIYNQTNTIDTPPAFITTST